MNMHSPDAAFDTPVCLIIFRRPDHTRRVLEAIARAKPQRLFVVADGPRPDHPDDPEACAATRSLIEQIDWPCEVIKNYSDVNLGCGLRPSSGIDWLFEQVDEAIILEDDCVPDPSFLPFCAELLARYRSEQKVMQISGTTYRREDTPIADSYYFSRAPGCWGWATWKRAWKHYDITVREWSDARHGTLLTECLGNQDLVREYAVNLNKAQAAGGVCSFWDYQWGFACFLNSGLSIVPKSNLVSNVGFGADATHTMDPLAPVAFIPTRPLQFPLVHPQTVAPNPAVESYLRKLDSMKSRNAVRQGLLRSCLRRLRGNKAAKAASSAFNSAFKRVFS